MTLPTLTQTWTIRPNRPILPSASGGVNNQRYILEWKNSMKALGATVSGSSDSSTTGMDGVDRWTDYTKIVTSASGVRSWIVLRFPNIAAHFEVCLYFQTSNSSFQSTDVIVSPAVGFGTANGGGNGSTTSRPTATDERVYVAQGNQFTGALDAGLLGNRAHFWATTGGTCFYWARTHAGVIYSFGCLGLVPNPAPEWVTSTRYYFAVQITANRATWANTVTTITKINTIECSCYMTGEMLASQMITTYQNFPGDLNVGYPLGGVGLVSTTAGARGKIGTMPDMYWGAETNINVGDCYPNNGTRLWVQMGHIVLPWDGSVPIVAN